MTVVPLVIGGLLLAVHAIKPNHPGGGASAIITPIALAVVAATQWGAISLAKKNAAGPGNNPDSPQVP